MVIAVDVDGTLYDGQRVAEEAVTALTEACALGHTIVIVTGRRWEQLGHVIPSVLPLAARAVCEEGGVLAVVAAGEVRPLCELVPAGLVDALTGAGIAPLDVGHVVVGTPAHFAAEVAALGERATWGRTISRNKDSLALVPPGCDKGRGLAAAIADLGLDGVPVLAIGDAANDLPMFRCATFAVAVANCDVAVRSSGIPTIMDEPSGKGVAEALRRFAL